MSVRRTILVTGASRGIGRAIASRLATDGDHVLVHGRAPSEALSSIASETGGRVLTFDVADREACRTALEGEIESHGAPYGVVLCAGLTADGPLVGMSDRDWDTVLDTNLGGFFNVLRPLVLPMIQRRAPGRIVVLSSIAGLVGNRGQVNYAASKAGLIGATKSLALELASRRITVNAVAPGLIATDMTSTMDPIAHDEIMKLIPMRRAGLPADVAHAVAFLLSDGASYITREVLTVGGGLGS
ncbi:MAG: 3-oxoacyl-ACP reductase FabG [Myxococcales bacterium]|nr:3-oxoacyl-ACP reductase FabG [Myxococcales bacterium]